MPPREHIPVPENILSLQLPRDFSRFAPKLQCSNVTCKFKLNAHSATKPISVIELSRKLPGVAYDPKRFAACMLRCGSATVLIFDGGSCVCVGTVSENQARLAGMRVANFLLRTGEFVSFSNFAVQNIVCRGAAGFLVNIKDIDAAYRVEATYEPDKFPGLIFRMKSSKIVIIVFISGCCIVTGSKTFANSEIIWAWFYNAVLRRFRMHAVACPTSAEYRMSSYHEGNTVAADCERLWARHCAKVSEKRRPLTVRDLVHSEEDFYVCRGFGLFSEAVANAHAVQFPGPGGRVVGGKGKRVREALEDGEAELCGTH